MSVPGCEGLRVLVTTCEKYYATLPIFAHQFNKYWSPEQECVVAGYGPLTVELPPNFGFVSLGDQDAFPLKRWSDALLKVMGIPDVLGDVFCLMLDDYWLKQPVDLDLIGVAYRYMQQFEYVAKFDLAHDRLYAYGADLGYGEVCYNGQTYHLVKSMPGSPYHSSVWPGLHRKQAFRAYVQPEWSPWDVELAGTFKLSHLSDRWIVVGTHEGALDISLGLRGGDPGTLHLDGLSDEDVQELRDLGHLEPWEPSSE